MRSGVHLWSVVGALLCSCAGGYPLEPTPCDDYCHATKDLQCSFYLPAACVVSCEQQGLGTPACSTELDAVVACFEAMPDAADRYCSANYFGGPRVLPCSEQLGLLQVCASYARSGGL